ncbi:hypothetical protein EAG_16281 [Camponotus floridanus]|uniref:Uncharacterized protein n=1 Tax=Camponotus floridanus TaxID=104421 RepID=E2AGA8_CAMFO|nr:hypothetical protein EAG_16281 [Camponotus floridanus]
MPRPYLASANGMRAHGVFFINDAPPLFPGSSAYQKIHSMPGQESVRVGCRWTGRGRDRERIESQADNGRADLLLKHQLYETAVSFRIQTGLRNLIHGLTKDRQRKLGKWKDSAPFFIYWSCLIRKLRTCISIIIPSLNKLRISTRHSARFFLDRGDETRNDIQVKQHPRGRVTGTFKSLESRSYVLGGQSRVDKPQILSGGYVTLDGRRSLASISPLAILVMFHFGSKESRAAALWRNCHQSSQLNEQQILLPHWMGYMVNSQKLYQEPKDMKHAKRLRYQSL